MQIAEQHVGLFNLSEFMNAGLDIKANGAGAIIGSEGGVVMVTDPDSPLHGTSLTVPPGALDTPVRITIQEGGHNCAFGLGPSLRLLPCGLHFKHAATLTVHLNKTMAETDDFDTTSPACYRYDESSNRWIHNSTTRLERLGNTVLCELRHL